MKRNKFILFFLIIVLVVVIIVLPRKKSTSDFLASTGNVEENKMWIGTFQLVWNELINDLGKEIEFEDGESKLANELNQQKFTKDMISESSYYIAQGMISTNLKEKIENDIKNKFNTNSEVLDRINWNSNNNEFLIYAMLKKEFTFETPFIERRQDTFGNSQEKVKYFGLDASTLEKTFKQVSVLFYNSDTDFAVKISTLEGEDVILYRTDNITNFNDTYAELEKKSQSFSGRKSMIREQDELKIPFIKTNAIINYDELCNRKIKNTNGACIKYAIQTINFSIDNYGGNVKSEAYVDMYMSESMQKPRYFNFTDKFVLYLKEKDKSTPYFALLVDNTDVLVKD